MVFNPNHPTYMEENYLEDGHKYSQPARITSSNPIASAPTRQPGYARDQANQHPWCDDSDDGEPDELAQDPGRLMTDKRMRHTDYPDFTPASLRRYSDTFAPPPPSSRPVANINPRLEEQANRNNAQVVQSPVTDPPPEQRENRSYTVSGSRRGSKVQSAEVPTLTPMAWRNERFWNQDSSDGEIYPRPTYASSDEETLPGDGEERNEKKKHVKSPWKDRG